MDQPKRYPALNGLKGLFMIVIVLYHTFSELTPPTPILDAVPFSSFITKFGGDLGDCMFFILSGFLMSTAYLPRIRSGEISFKDYFLKRLRKLYPLYLLSNLAMMVLTVLEHGPSGVNLQRIAFTALLELGGGLDTHPYNGPSWFISTLFLCYVLFYFLARISSTPTRYMAAVLLCIILGNRMLSDDLAIPFFTGGNGIGIMNFFIGCALAEIYPLVHRRSKRWLPAVTLFLLSAAFLMLMLYGVEIIAGSTIAAFGFVVSPMILYLSLDCTPISSILQWKPILFLGKISISTYFWHYSVLTAYRLTVQRLGMAFSEIHLPLCFLLMLLCGLLSWRFIETKGAFYQPASAPSH